MCVCSFVQLSKFVFKLFIRAPVILDQGLPDSSKTSSLLIMSVMSLFPNKHSEIPEIRISTCEFCRDKIQPTTPSKGSCSLTPWGTCEHKDHLRAVPGRAGLSCSHTFSLMTLGVWRRGQILRGTSSVVYIFVWLKAHQNNLFKRPRGMQEKYGISHYNAHQDRKSLVCQKKGSKSKNPHSRSRKSKKDPRRRRRGWMGEPGIWVMKPSVSYNENFRSQSQTSRQLVDQIWLATKGRF